MDNKFPMVAKTFGGLEDILAEELSALGAENIEPGKRMVAFQGDIATMYKANLCCRTALRILKPIVKFTASDPDELYDKVRDVEWEKYLSPNSTFSIDSTVYSSDFTHSRYVTYRTKDGIVDHFNDIFGKRPSIRLSGADILLNVHIAEDRITISLDSSGEPLSRRGYRQEHTDAPLNEVLAAGIIMKTGWKGDSNFVDPMCGSGTFLIEAALIAANINPGIFRDNFAFEKWPDFNRDLFEKIYNDDSAEREFKYKIFGADIDPEAVAIARRNIKRARLSDMIDISCRSFEDWEMIPEPGILVTNPPYGERLRPDDITGLYKRLGSTLKHKFKGYDAWILGYNDDNFASIGLKPSVKFPILNGNLECELREYVLFDGSYAGFKTNGGSVHNSGFNRGDKTKTKRISDKEWEKETRKFNKQSKVLKAKKVFKDNKDLKDKDGKNFKGNKLRTSKDSHQNKKRQNENDFRMEGKRFTRRNNAIVTPDKGPRLPEESATVFSQVPMRSRKNHRLKKMDQNSNND